MEKGMGCDMQQSNPFRISENMTPEELDDRMRLINLHWFLFLSDDSELSSVPSGGAS